MRLYEVEPRFSVSDFLGFQVSIGELVSVFKNVDEGEWERCRVFVWGDYKGIPLNNYYSGLLLDNLIESLKVAREIAKQWDMNPEQKIFEVSI